MFQLTPATVLAALERPSGGEGHAWIRVLANNHAANGCWGQAIECSKQVRIGGLSRQAQVLPSWKNRLPRVDFKVAIDGIKVRLNISEDPLPVGPEIETPVDQEIVQG